MIVNQKKVQRTEIEYVLSHNDVIAAIKKWIADQPQFTRLYEPQYAIEVEIWHEEDAGVVGAAVTQAYDVVNNEVNIP